MRTLDSNELQSISGGMLPPRVPGSGGAVGGVGGTGGTGGSSDPSGPVPQQELVNGLETVVNMAEEGTLGSGTMNALFFGINLSALGADTMKDNVMDAVAMCKKYEAAGLDGETPEGDQSGDGLNIPWDNIDFGYYSDDGSLNCSLAVHNLFQDIADNKPLHINPYSIDLHGNGAKGIIGMNAPTSPNILVYGTGAGLGGAGLGSDEFWVLNGPSVPPPVTGTVTVGAIEPADPGDLTSYVLVGMDGLVF